MNGWIKNRAIPVTLGKKDTLYTILKGFSGIGLPVLIAKENNYTIYEVCMSHRITFVVSEITNELWAKRYEITMYTNLDKHPCYQSIRTAKCDYLNEVDVIMQTLLASERI